MTSTDANAQPEIDPNYFDDEFDLEILVEAMNFIRQRVAKTAAWQEISEGEIVPGENVKTDDELRGMSYYSDMIFKKLAANYHSYLDRSHEERAYHHLA